MQIKMKTTLFAFLCFFASYCFASSEYEELTPSRAKELGFRIEKEEKGNGVEFKVEYPQSISKWNAAHSPSISIVNDDGKLIADLHSFSKVSVDERAGPSLFFQFGCRKQYDASITFVYTTDEGSYSFIKLEITSIMSFEIDE